jgi:hypothetical protein
MVARIDCFHLLVPFCDRPQKNFDYRFEANSYCFLFLFSETLLTPSVMVTMLS